MKLNKNQQKYYGLFYKSHGEWIGPWFKEILTKEQIKGELPSIKRVLKSKVAVLKVKFV
jgi:hypothetical protein